MWAFSDESERSAVMLLAVALIDPGDVDSARRRLRALLLAGQRQVHTAKESPRRRRALLATVAATDGLSVTVLRYRRPPAPTELPAGICCSKPAPDSSSAPA